ncbi:sigma-54-dependent transcriptional regulator [Mariprofundus aestuarium]
MSMKKIYLLGFPEAISPELCVQLGRVAPDLPVEAQEQFQADCLQADSETLFFLMDSHLANMQAKQIFQHAPMATLVVLADQMNADRASQLMIAGATDYRALPCADEILSIYIRKAQHQADLSSQANKQRKGTNIFVTRDIETRRLLDQVALVAPSRASILVLGESGTGKERLSQYVHQCSNRHDCTFVAVNCAAIPEGMIEAELFGYEKGAFTGATGSRPGKFELAHGGTLLLDEITEMPMHMQAKLLRVIQEGEVDRLGGRSPIKVDVRIIATSNRNIEEAISEGVFRQDLYYRLNVVTVSLPPLRNRPDDIIPLAEHFLGRFSEMYGKPAPRISEACMDYLQQYNWPGNAREIENCMHRAFLTCAGDQLQVEYLSLDGASKPPVAGEGEIKAGISIRDMEQALIKQTIKHVKGNRTEAAKLLGISIRTLRNKLKEMDAGMVLAENMVSSA